MKRILIYLLKTTKKYALIFNENKDILNLEDLTNLTKEQIILNGLIKYPENPNESKDFFEKWELKSAKIKNIEKNNSNFKVTLDVDFKLIIRKNK